MFKLISNNFFATSGRFVRNKPMSQWLQHIVPFVLCVLFMSLHVEAQKKDTDIKTNQTRIGTQFVPSLALNEAIKGNDGIVLGGRATSGKERTINENGTSPAGVSNNLAQFHIIHNADMVQSGVGGVRNVSSAPLTISGLSGTVLKAYLYWHGPTNSSDPAANATIDFNGTSITGENIGFADDNDWGYANSQAYRADVTSLITGDGTYGLFELKKDNGAININGLSCIVFFDDGNSANNKDYLIFEGNDSNIPSEYDSSGWSLNISGINYTSDSASLSLHVADGQDDNPNAGWDDDDLILNGSVLSSGPDIFMGNSVPNYATHVLTKGGLWDIKTFDITSYLTPGINNLTLTSGFVSDALGLIVAIVSLPPGAAPSQFGTAKIRGMKFSDVNGNGTKDQFEPGLQDWTIQLFQGNSLITSSTTDPNGNYDFPNLLPGTYTVSEVQQAGWVESVPLSPESYTVIVDSGEIVSGKNFGNRGMQRVIQGMIFNDLDGDSVKDALEPGLQGWVIVLDGEITDTTDINGNFEFAGVSIDTHTVSEQNKLGWAPTYPTGGTHTISFESDSILTGINFGNRDTCTQVSSEFSVTACDTYALPWDTTVTGSGDYAHLYIATTGCDSIVTAHVTINNSDFSEFTINTAITPYELPWGQMVSESGDYSFTDTTANGCDSIVTAHVTIIRGQIRGAVYNDINGNGVKDIGDDGMTDWIINLTGSFTATDTTDAFGNYSFGNLSPGTYTLREVGQNGWRRTSTNPDDINLVAGDTVTGIDFGNSVLVAFTGIKNIPGDYATIADAVTDLNQVGVGAGGVVFNVAANHSETTTFPIVVTITGSSGNPIIFQKSGVGANPLISRTDAGSYTTSVIGGQGDGIIQLNGTDYITFDGISVSASQSSIEYGYLTHKPSGTDGCQNVTIKNSTITMTKGSNGHVLGIYLSNGPAGVNSSTGVTVTNDSGRNANITLVGNSISNVHSGIYCWGSSALYDSNFTIGQVGAGNTIQNYGGTLDANAYGVHCMFVKDPTVSYNTIDNEAGGGSPHKWHLYGIYFRDVRGTVVGNSNSITMSNSTASSSPDTYYIRDSTTASSLTITNNTFAARTMKATFVTLIHSSNNTPTKTISGNLTVGTITFTGSPSGTFYGYFNFGNPSGGTEIISNNTFSNINNFNITHPININTTSTHNVEIFGNTISDIEFGSTDFYGIRVSTCNVVNIYSNRISNCSGAGNLYGISLTSSSIDSINIYSNEITTLLGSTGSSVTGISSFGTNLFLHHNNVRELRSLTGFVIGVQSSTGTNHYVYNNVISDLTSPNCNQTIGIRGILISSTSASSHQGVYYNTVYLNATSSGANFGTAGIYHTTSATPTTSLLDMRNNIIVNISTANGTGKTAAYRRSSTQLENYGSSSNNNLFYAGTPSSKNVIFYDGTNFDSTLSLFQTRVSPRETNSVTEFPPFINVSTTPYDLHVDPTITTVLKDAGLPVTSPVAITDDFDGNIRHVTTPDLGADELTSNPVVITGSASSITQTTATLNGEVNPNGDSTTAYFNWGLTETYGNATPDTLLGDGSSFIPVNSIITGLTPNTQYSFTLFGSNANGADTGSNGTFKTLPNLPAVVILPSSSVDMTSAQLNGLANPHGDSTYAWFVWGADTLSPVSSDTVYIGNGNSILPFNVSIDQLLPNTSYWYKACAKNKGGTTTTDYAYYLTTLASLKEYVADEFTVGLYHLNEAGSLIQDYSDNHIDGETSDSALGGPPISTGGKYGNARSFNTIDQYLEFPPSSYFDFGDSSFTVEAWVKPHLLGSTELAIVSYGNPNDTSEAFNFKITNNYKLSVSLSETGFTLCTSQTNVAPVVDDVWQHVAVVVDRTNEEIRFYHNGYLIASTLSGALPEVIYGTNAPLRVGLLSSLTTHSTGTLPSLLDEIRLSSIARQPQEFEVFSKLRIEAKIDLNGNGIYDTTDINSLPAGTSVLVNIARDSTFNVNFSLGNDTLNQEFPNLLVGEYTITQTSAPVGWMQTSNSSYSLTINENGTIDTVQFSYFKLISLSGKSFNDVNGNGVKNVNEPGLEGWTIHLDDTTTVITDSSGYYSFMGVGPGTYTISMEHQDGWYQTTPDSTGFSVTALSGNDIANMNFGNFLVGSISGSKFKDSNENGTWDISEPGLSGWRIVLSGTVHKTTLTDTNGHFEFTGLPLGVYQVYELNQAGWTQTFPANFKYTDSITGGQVLSGLNFGNYLKPNTISGMNFFDINYNNIKDSLEQGLENWKINLFDLTHTLVAVDTTDSLGNYSFDSLTSGMYFVKEVQKDGWVQTYPTSINIAAGNQPGMYFLELSDGGSKTGLDFGNALACRYVGPIGGLWSNPANWSCGHAPDAGTPIIIPRDTIVVVDSLPSDSIHSIRIQRGGGLIFGNLNQVFRILGSIQIDAGALLSFPEGDSSQISCFGDWINNGIFDPGSSTIIFSGDSAQTIVAGDLINVNEIASLKTQIRMPNVYTANHFNNLVIDGENTTVIGNLRILNRLSLYQSLNTRVEDTVFIQNSSPNAIDSTGVLPRGTIMRAIDDNAGGNYRFESASTFLTFNAADDLPDSVIITTLSDTITNVFDLQWRVVGGTQNTVNNTIIIDSIRKFSKWVFGKPGSGYRKAGNGSSSFGIPTVRRAYTINTNGGGNFNASLQLRYDDAELLESESDLVLLQGPYVADSIKANWNLVSVPVIPETSYNVSALFPTAITGAFQFIHNAGYVSQSTLTLNMGYWLKFGSRQYSGILGEERTTAEVEVQNGWNMIGTISFPVATANILDNSAGISSFFFGYNNGYYAVDTLRGMRAYWVKANNTGTITLQSSGTSHNKLFSLRSMLNKLNTLAIDDNNGHHQDLLFGRKNKQEQNLFAMPPLPPTGIFDARFGTNSMGLFADEDVSTETPIKLTEAEYPVTISWDVSDEVTCRAELFVDGKKTTLQSKGSVKVLSASSNLKLKLLSSSASETPTKVALLQNYPNPFNPSTVIRYQLPVSSHITLKIYDVLGREIVTLVDEIQDAGFKSVEFDATTIPSGIYFYRLQVGNFTETKKLLLLR